MGGAMSQVCKGAAWAIAVAALTTTAAFAGGAWVPERGDGDIQFGYSRKTAYSSWNVEGDPVDNASGHDFRYAYLSGEIGFGHGLSMRYSALYLNGYEGTPGNEEQNRGTSELFLGVKYRVHEGTWPMAVAAHMRTSILYDQYGTYDRHLFLPDEDDVDGDLDDTEALFNGVNSEWRGLLGEDYGLMFLASRSMFDGGWLNLEIGYTYRTGNLADEIPVWAELGYRTPWRPLAIKGTISYVQSVGNNDEVRDPDDRFGCSDTNCFPDASRAVVGGSVMFDLGKNALWWVEAGYNWFVWGESTRQYEEPFFSIGRRF